MTKAGDKDWAAAKARCRLSVEDVRMAKQLGFKPRTLIKNIPSRSQQWKAPVKVWIRELYEKRFAKDAWVAETTPVGDRAWPEDAVDFYDDEAEEDFDIPANHDEDPGGAEARETDQSLLRRQRDFRAAADYVAAAFARLPIVEKVVLFGSVALPLAREVPRFRNFRRAGVRLRHECKDVDLAVWVSAVDSLKSLQKARGQALNELLARKDIGVAHHQVDVFLMESGTDRYLGRLCNFGVCPKGKPECRVPGCGSSLFLRQHEDFVLDRKGLAPDRSVMLYDRAGDTDSARHPDVAEPRLPQAPDGDANGR